MAGSHSKSIIDSVENFWNTEMDGLSHDDNLKILTAGLNNMYSIAKCAKDLLDDKDGLKAYLTYQRLVKVLDFAFEGVQSLKKNTSESGLSTIGPVRLLAPQQTPNLLVLQEVLTVVVQILAEVPFRRLRVLTPKDDVHIRDSKATRNRDNEIDPYDFSELEAGIASSGRGIPTTTQVDRCKIEEGKVSGEHPIF
ncbi:hypothetical protein CLAIMM_14329 [Cladophialophora immunda]|nr:hypothetical protein CLAIMM_14329 [Cladophialophora immunda]